MITTQYDDNEPDPSKFFKWTVEIEINEIWVADGFEVTADGIKEMIQEAIGILLRARDASTGYQSAKR